MGHRYTHRVDCPRCTEEVAVFSGVDPIRHEFSCGECGVQLVYEADGAQGFDVSLKSLKGTSFRGDMLVDW